MAWGKGKSGGSSGKSGGGSGGGSKSCNHSGSWGDWFYLEGVTSGIMMRTKKCDKCGRLIDSQTKSV